MPEEPKPNAGVDAGRLKVEGLGGADAPVADACPKGFVDGLPKVKGEAGAILGDGCPNENGAGEAAAGLSGGF